MLKAKIFKNGQSDAVRLPKEFRFGAKEVLIHKVGNVVILIPQDNPWLNLKESLSEFSEDFLEERNQSLEPQKREKL